MKTEPFKAPVKRGVFADDLRNLQPGQAIRLKTANQWRNASGQMSFEKKRSGVNYASVAAAPKLSNLGNELAAWAVDQALILAEAGIVK